MKLPFIRARSLQIPSPCRCPVGGVQAAARDYPTTHALTHIHRPRRRSAVVRTRKRHCRSPRGCLSHRLRGRCRVSFSAAFLHRLSRPAVVRCSRDTGRAYSREARASPSHSSASATFINSRRAHSVARSSGIHRELLIFFCLTYHIFIPRIVIAEIISFR